MNTFKMICNVQTDFVHSKGDLFKVTADMVGKPIDVPVGVRNTLLFKYYLADGTIQLPDETCPEFDRKAAQDAPEGETAEIPAEQEETLTDGSEAKTEEPVAVMLDEEKPKRTRKRKG